MEPFGLFQILQNLLAAQGEKSGETNANANGSEPPRQEPQTTEGKEMPPVKNAAAEFLERHEKRAQNLKRK